MAALGATLEQSVPAASTSPPAAGSPTDGAVMPAATPPRSSPGAEYRFVDVMFPPPGADNGPWKRVALDGVEARRASSHGPGFATVQRFREPVHREDEPRLCGLYFDFDDAEDPDRALRDARALVGWFASEGLPWSAFRIEFSGNRGAHVTIEPGVFGIEARTDLTAIVKEAALWLAERLGLGTLDRLVYSARRLWRLRDTIHPRSGYYCVEIAAQDLAAGITHVRTLARAPRGPLYAEDDRNCDEHPTLAAWFRSFVEEHEQRLSTRGASPGAEPVAEHALASGNAAEIVRLLAPHYRTGQRHAFTLALAGLLTKHGVAPGEIEYVVKQLASGDREQRDRMAAVRTTARRRASGKRVAGASALAELLPGTVMAKLEALLACPCPEFQHPAAPRVVTPLEAESVLAQDVQTALGAPAGTITVINAATGAGKTTAVIRAAKDHAQSVAFFAREHGFLEDVEARARAAGVSVAKWPRLDDTTCPEGRADEIAGLYERGFDGTAAICVNCPMFPANSGSCPRMYAMIEIENATLRLMPVANLRPSGPCLRSDLEVRERYVRNSAIVFDEDPTSDLARSLTVTRRQIELFVALLDRAIEGGNGRKAGVSLEIFALSKRVREALGCIDAILAGEQPAADESRVVDLAARPCPAVSLDEPEIPSLARKLDRLLAVTSTEYRDEPSAVNLLPLALRAAHHAHLGRPLHALRRGDRIELQVTPRPTPEIAFTILDATASAEVLRAAFPGFDVRVTAPITLARPDGARVVQFVDRSYSRQSLDGATKIAEAARAIAAAVRAHAGGIVRPTLGLVTYKRFVAPLTEAIAAELPEVTIAGALHFGGLRGKNDLEGVDVLVVLGTPRPNPSAIEVRALALAADGGGGTARDAEGGVEVLGYGGKRVRRFRGAKEGAYAIAEEHAIAAEIVQALGRQRLERHGGVTLLFSSWPLPLPAGAVEIRSAREDGLVLDPRRAAAYEAFEGKLVGALVGAPEGLTIAKVAEVTGIDRRHLHRYLDLLLARRNGCAIDRSLYPARIRDGMHALDSVNLGSAVTSEVAPELL